MNHSLFFIPALLLSPAATFGQITKPKDAPKPLPPAESAKVVKLPEGFGLELIASEPLIRQPSGLCFAADGSLFVTEAHGYNMEGQFDIEELNKTGKLDRIVRRISAPPEAVRKAEKVQTGAVKRLLDRNGDGIMDRAEVWAEGLPVCLGLAPARGGVIVVCPPHILFLADRDGDGEAEVREKLFTGIKVGIIERRVNSPQWGLDNWIYVDGGQGGRVTGPNLPAPVDIPVTGFRFKPDGSAIEPISGHTRTYGFTFNAEGDRFIVSTGRPGIQVAPLLWHYLSRNPDVALSAPLHNSAAYKRTFPVSEPHPWRTKRHADPGFSKYYSDRYGAAESVPDGYFTSACSPLVYVDSALPGLQGQLLSCEPAQNMVHRAQIVRDGIQLHLRRVPEEERAEFLVSKDVWFHPVHLGIGPAGGVWIADFYREIIEDYSAIPRYLQQLYGLKDGENHGRLWRLVHKNMPKALSSDMSALDVAALVREVGSARAWRRQTARRLLLERAEQLDDTSLALLSLTVRQADTAVAINALYTLDGLDGLNEEILMAALAHQQPGVRRHALRLAERRFDAKPELLAAGLKLKEDRSALVRLQLALSLGESKAPNAAMILAELARNHGDETWMDGAILSSLGNRGGEALSLLLTTPPGHGEARGIVKRLFRAVANRRDSAELSATIVLLAGLADRSLQSEGLQEVRAAFKSVTKVALEDPARAALKKLVAADDGTVRAAALELTRVLALESAAERKTRLAKTLREAGDLALAPDRRLAAVRALASENDAALVEKLFNAYPSSTPAIRRAILEAAFARTAYLSSVVTALEEEKLPLSALSAIQRAALTGQKGAPGVRARALLANRKSPDPALAAKFTAALKAKRDPAAGEAVFRQHCATCHQAHGLGFAVGPDLTSESRRAEETIVHDILAPSDNIVAGHETYLVETNDGRTISGILVNESANSLTLSLAGGVRSTALRKDIKSLKTLPVSLMPEALAEALKPADVANVIAWLRQPPSRRLLFDEGQDFVKLLTQGDGTASIVSDDRFTGAVSLRVTPPQRFSNKIPGWNFPIRQDPGPGEFRYLRLAWKAPGARGAMVELAHNGAWPASDSPKRRYFSGANTTKWQATRVSEKLPEEWTVVTRDLWKDFGDFTLTGIAPTAMGGPVWFDRIELLRELPEE